MSSRDEREMRSTPGATELPEGGPGSGCADRRHLGAPGYPDGHDSGLWGDARGLVSRAIAIRSDRRHTAPPTVAGKVEEP